MNLKGTLLNSSLECSCYGGIRKILLKLFLSCICTGHRWTPMWLCIALNTKEMWMWEPHPDSRLQATPVTIFQVKCFRVLSLYLFIGVVSAGLGGLFVCLFFNFPNMQPILWKFSILDMEKKFQKTNILLGNANKIAAQQDRGHQIWSCKSRAFSSASYYGIAWIQ